MSVFGNDFLTCLGRVGYLTDKDRYSFHYVHLGPVGISGEGRFLCQERFLGGH
jgi:hypothetical protein